MICIVSNVPQRTKTSKVEGSQAQAMRSPWEVSFGRPGYERRTFEQGRNHLLPELDILGWLRFHQALTGALGPDRHPGAFEIHYLVRGHLRWWVEKEHFDFSAGQVFVMRPNELHGAEEGSLEPCEHYWLRVKFPERGNLPSLTAGDTRGLKDAYERLTYRTFAGSRGVEELFRRLLEEHMSRPPVFSKTMARATLHALLITILRDHDRHSRIANQKPLITWRVRRTREWLEKRLYESNVSLNELAASLGLSPSGLRMRFQAETGYTPKEYLLHRRIEEARRRLTETNDRIVDIAYELGFPSSQYFATVFLRQTGSTPRAYREKHQKK
jgi:AraC-like DNA-binding protein/mannose-6-phosphate isomerase-like protein (cupin superfamily)